MDQQADPSVTRSVLACVPGAIPAAERAAHFALIRNLLGAAETRENVPNGVSFTFDAGRLEDIARFLANERKCCPFLDFELAAPSFTDRVRLTLSGPEGTREFLEAEFAGA